MAILCVNWETAHLYGEAWISHHRLRHRVFVERHGWEVPSFNCLEYDQFDTPAAQYLLWLDREGQARGTARLIPTTRPYMLKVLWPHLIAGVMPECAEIWEASRFGCDRDLDPPLRRRVIAELICACQELGLRYGVRTYVGVMPLGIFKHVIGAAGCPITMAGPSCRMGRHDVAAAYIEVSASVVEAVRERAGLSGRVLVTEISAAA